MSLDWTPSSDLDGWTPPDNMVTEKFTNVDRMSDIPTIGSDQDIAELASALADADAPPQAQRARKSRKRNIPRIHVGGKRKARRRAPKKDLDALSTMATVNGPVSSTKRAKRILKNHNRKEGLWLDKRATLHSLISKITWAKVPLVRLLRR